MLRTATLASIILLPGIAQCGAKAKIVLAEIAELVAFSPDGKRLAAKTRHDIVVWDVEKGKVVVRLEGVSDAKRLNEHVSAAAFNADGSMLISATREGVIKIWDLPSGKERRAVEARVSPIIAVAFLGKDKAASITGIIPWAIPPTIISVWDWEARKMERTAHLKHRFYALGMATFSPDGRLLVAADPGFDNLTVWDVATGEELFSFEESTPGRGYFSGDSKLLAARLEEGILVWDVATAKAIHALKTPTSKDYVNAMAFSPDKKRLAAVVHTPSLEESPPRLRSALYVWDLASGKEVVRKNLEGGATAAFSPDGRRLALSGGGGISIWDDPME